MPTSATGRSTSSARRRRGFTLLELIVVLAIVGVIVTLATLAVPDAARDRVALEGERLLQEIENCRRSSVLSGVPAGIRLAPDAWEQVRYRGEWRAGDMGGTARHRLGSEFVLRIEPPRSAAADADPDVVCLPTGETLLPTVRLAHRAGEGFYEIAPDEEGRVVAAWIEPPA